MKRIIKAADTTDWEWIDLLNPSKEELQEVAAKYGLHPASVIDSLQPEHLPKYEEIGNDVFMIVRIYDPTAHEEADTIQELTNKLAIFFSEKYIITIHRHELAFIDEVNEKYVQANLGRNSSGLLIKLLKAAFKTFEPPTRFLAEELDNYEAEIFLTSRMPALTKGLYHLKRKASVCKRLFRLSEVILSNLQLNSTLAPEVQDLKDLYVHLETLFDEINESTNNLINIYLSLSSQKTNEVMRVLTIFSAFFLPLTFIAGVYGMNFEFMPELDERIGYPAVMGLMAIVTVCIYLWFKKKHWL